MISLDTRNLHNLGSLIIFTECCTMLHIETIFSVYAHVDFMYVYKVYTYLTNIYAYLSHIYYIVI